MSTEEITPAASAAPSNPAPAAPVEQPAPQEPEAPQEAEAPLATLATAAQRAGASLLEFVEALGYKRDEVAILDVSLERGTARIRQSDGVFRTRRFELPEPESTEE